MGPIFWGTPNFAFRKYDQNLCFVLFIGYSALLPIMTLSKLAFHYKDHLKLIYCIYKNTMMHSNKMPLLKLRTLQLPFLHQLLYCKQHAEILLR